MAGEKYIIATADNNFQITVRNILNPRGYTFLAHCHDAVSFMRLIRTYTPDIVIADLSVKIKDIRAVIEAIDDELICTCIIIGEPMDMEMFDIVDKAKAAVYCSKGHERESLIHTIELGILNFKRIAKQERKLKEMAETYETRKAVDKAKWILIDKYKITEHEAYQRIRKKSMDTRFTMRAIAEAIICTYEVERGEG